MDLPELLSQKLAQRSSAFPVFKHTPVSHYGCRLLTHVHDSGIGSQCYVRIYGHFKATLYGLRLQSYDFFPAFQNPQAPEPMLMDKNDVSFFIPAYIDKSLQAINFQAFISDLSG